jgi:hypothetical protein
MLCVLRALAHRMMPVEAPASAGPPPQEPAWARLPPLCRASPLCAQSEEQLCEQPLEAAGSLGALQLLRRAAANLFRLSWLLALFAPVVLSAPLVGDYLGLSRARWLRLLRWVLGVWERAGHDNSAGAAAARCRHLPAP